MQTSPLNEPRRDPAHSTAEEPRTEAAGHLRARAISGSLWTAATYGAAQLFRFASNLVLTRLLYPEVFGLMALMNVFMYGLKMLTDVGIAPGIIQSPRGDEPRYYNTAWTLQVVRGFAMCLAACAIAWPASLFYHQPALQALLPAVALTAAINGFQSTAQFTLRRRVQLARLGILELIAQGISLPVTVLLAYRFRSVWALVIGAIVGEVARMAMSHRLLPEIRNRFTWDRESATTILHFAKWIVLSSAFFFVGGQFDRLYLGRVASLVTVGIFSIAAQLTESILGVVSSLTQSVLFPVLSEVSRETPVRIQDVYYRARLLLDVLAIPALGILSTTGGWLISVLYDGRYADAGWMVQILAVRVAMAAVLAPCEVCLLALGQPKYSFQRSLARALWIVGGLPIGWYFGGIYGLLWALGTSEVPVLIVLWTAFARRGLLRPRREAAAALLFGFGAILGLLFLRGIGRA